MNLKRELQKLIFPVGSVQSVRSGYLKGKRIIISENTQWAPLFGRWEPSMQKIMNAVIRKGDIVYDLGANFGLHGMLCSKLTGKDGYLFNFEPLPDNILEIERNYGLNDVSNYTNVQKAVSNKNTTLKFKVAKHSGQGKLVENEFCEGIVDVESITLDQFILNGNKPPNFIKMDIEGAEGDALEGFSLNLEKTSPIMIIELHSPEADKKVGDFLKFHKYKAYRFNTFKSIHFEEIKNLSLPYPHKEGIWGTVLCLGPKHSLQDYTW